MTLEAAFARHLATLELPAGPALVAVSGGPDSLALLHLLARTGDRHALVLRVAHADHGLHPESGAVAERVADTARALGFPCDIGRLQLGAGAGETVAREARYAWLRTVMARVRADVLFTGHQRDDQVETVLMRFLRGSGPAGLAGMAPVAGRIVRPLLPFSRSELRAWLAGIGVEPWADPANVQRRHLRSWVRSELLPLLRDRLPDVEDRILVVAHQARLDRTAWDAALTSLPLEFRHDEATASIASAVLRGYDSGFASGLVRALGRRVGLGLGPRRVARVLHLVERGQSGRRVALGRGWEAALSFGRLEFAPATAGTPVGQATVSGPRGEVLLGPWRVRWDTEPAPEQRGRDVPAVWVIPGEYGVRPWRAGDRIWPAGGTGSRLVVRCMQELKVGRRDRAGWPVLTCEEAVIWVPGVSRSEFRMAAPGEEALRIDADRG